MNDLSPSLPAELRDQLHLLLGAAGLLENSADLQRFSTDASGQFFGLAAAILRPKTTQEMAQAMRLCAQAGCVMIAQGGRTGLSGGAASLRGSVILSTERMRGIIALDRTERSLLVWAGTPLQEVQEAALAQGFEYPVDIGARGTATIGGTIATNAGGLRVLRDGMTRNHIRGLEAVCADGSLISRLKGLTKDNAGADISQFLIGSEGRFAVITKALLNLQPAKPHRALALLAFENYESALKALRLAQDHFGPDLSAFEGMWPDYWQAVCVDWNMQASPFQAAYGFYVLLEISTREPEPMPHLSAWLEENYESLGLLDAIPSTSLAMDQRFWAIREAIGDLDGPMGPHISFDLSLPKALMDVFCKKCDALLGQSAFSCQVVKLGHIGDGNIHLLVSHDETAENIHEIERIIYSLVREFDGSITAEHGVGRIKRKWLSYCRSQTDLALEEALKRAFDPNNLLNPQ